MKVTQKDCDHFIQFAGGLMALATCILVWKSALGRAVPILPPLLLSTGFLYVFILRQIFLKGESEDDEKTPPTKNSTDEGGYGDEL